MNKKLLYLLLLLVWIVGGLFFMYKYLCSPDLITKIVEKRIEVPVEKRVEIPVEKIVKIRPTLAEINAIKDSILLTLKPVAKKPTKKAKINNGWQIADGKSFNTNSNEYYKTKINSYQFLPKTKSLISSISNTSSYLKKNKDRAVEIIGYYKNEEKNSSIFPDLGLARANATKIELTKLGVPAKQISTASKKITLLNKNFISNDTLKHAIDFKFEKYKEDANAKKIAAIKKRLFGKPLTVYFASNSENIELNKNQRNDINDIIFYLDNIENSKLAVDGHTDGTGNRDFNIKLSEKRANIVKDYLIKNGKIDSTKLLTNGFGPDKPIETNNTSEGRAKNRRVELTLK